MRLVVEAQYAADSRIDDGALVHGDFPLQRPIHPFRPLATRLMKYADTRLVSGGDDAGDTLRIEAQGLTCASAFAGTIAPRKAGLVVGAWDIRELPHLAPFEEALTEPGSFVAALLAIIGAIHGPAPLKDAGADPDRAVAAVAQAALDRLEGGETSSPPVECVTP